MLNLQIAVYFLIFSRLQVLTNYIKAYFDKNLQIKKNIRIFAT